MHGSDGGDTQVPRGGSLDLTVEADAPEIRTPRPVDLLGIDVALPLAASVLVAGLVVWVWIRRAGYPYDLEWMEGGMLAHAWRVGRFLPLYVEPGPEFVPFVYPPGYPTVLAVLGWVVGLGPTLGRAVSMVGTVAAAAAAGFVVARHGGNRVAAVVASAAFLGTYPSAGAFFDLVRPDALMMGLLAWSIAVGLERHPRAPVAAGLLLVLAILCKHSAAVFGLPLLIGIAARDGRRGAGRFLLAAAVPTLIVALYLQLKNQGRFLTYLVQVPASHDWFFDRIWPLTFQEVGSPLPVALATITGAALWLGVSGQRALPQPVTTFAAIGAGMSAAAVGTYAPPRDPGLLNVASGVAFFAFGAIPVAIGSYLVGRVAARAGEWETEPLVSWRARYGVGVCLTAFVASAGLRAHDGGFVNVHIPLFWSVCVAFGMVLCWLRERWPGDRMRAVVVLAATAQLSWSLARIDRQALIPTPADLALGERLVAAARSAEGEVLSPFAAWVPVYAGKAPSLHYMGLWDLEHEDGAFFAETARVRDAVAEQRWGMVFAGSQRFPYDLGSHYELLEELVQADDPALMPKTGWRARPTRVLVPVGGR